MSTKAERDLTRSGYKRALADQWREDLPPEDSAPPPRMLPIPEDWGVTRDEASDLLRRQMCPACGEGPWKSPLNHASRKHGIDRFTMRDICGLTTTETVAAPELSEVFRANNLGRDMTAVTEAAVRKRGKGRQRWTSAAREKQVANLGEVTAEMSRAALVKAHSPEAVAKRSETVRKRWETATPEERQAVVDRLKNGTRRDGTRRLATPEELSAQAEAIWDRRGRKPCGTRAAYRRGCRCVECVAANREHKRAEYRAKKERT